LAAESSWENLQSKFSGNDFVIATHLAAQSASSLLVSGKCANLRAPREILETRLRDVEGAIPYGFA